jgi:hypothetical protein
MKRTLATLFTLVCLTVAAHAAPLSYLGTWRAYAKGPQLGFVIIVEDDDANTVKIRFTDQSLNDLGTFDGNMYAGFRRAQLNPDGAYLKMVWTKGPEWNWKGHAFFGNTYFNFRVWQIPAPLTTTTMAQSLSGGWLPR